MACLYLFAMILTEKRNRMFNFVQWARFSMYNKIQSMPLLGGKNANLAVSIKRTQTFR